MANTITVNISELILWDKNPKEITDDQFEALCKYMTKYPETVILKVDGRDRQTVLGGNQRLKGARHLGWEDIDIVYVDVSNDDEAIEVALIDNNQFGSYIRDQLVELVEHTPLVLSDFHIDLDPVPLPDLFPKQEPDVEEDDFDPDSVEKNIHNVVLGDIWILGEHRLMCGDATNIDQVEELMDGAKADMVFTDPPYNIGYQGVNNKREIKNDKMDEGEFRDFLVQSLYGCETMYVCCSWQYAHIFKEAMEEINRKPKAMIVWDKVNPAQHLDKYYKQHELIFYYGDFGGHKTLRGDVWALKRQRNTVHPTMKPLELIEIALNDQPDKEIVLDTFGGSGSTLMACEQLNRKCYMMELDPHYVSVIIERWQKLTNQKAKRLGDLQ